MDSWSLAKCAAARESTLRLVDRHKNEATLPTEHCRRAAAAAANIQRVSGQKVADIYLANRNDTNAFATVDKEQRPIVIVTLPMFQAIGPDEDAWAALLGHEIAHHAKRHSEGRRSAALGSQVLGNAVALIVPGVGGLLAGTAAINASFGAYTRPQEAEADDLGLDWMIAAGYDPDGMRRLMARLSASSSGGMPAFLSTHPSRENRFEDAMARRAQRSYEETGK